MKQKIVVIKTTGVYTCLSTLSLHPKSPATYQFVKQNHFFVAIIFSGHRENGITKLIHKIIKFIIQILKLYIAPYPVFAVKCYSTNTGNGALYNFNICLINVMILSIYFVVQFFIWPVTNPMLQKLFCLTCTCGCGQSWRISVELNVMLTLC